jgi:hypothetical protein
LKSTDYFDTKFLKRGDLSSAGPIVAVFSSRTRSPLFPQISARLRSPLTRARRRLLRRARREDRDRAAMASATSDAGPKKRLVIKKMVLENFKSYAGAQHVGPFHKVRRDASSVGTCEMCLARGVKAVAAAEDRARRRRPHARDARTGPAIRAMRARELPRARIPAGPAGRPRRFLVPPCAFFFSARTRPAGRDPSPRLARERLRAPSPRWSPLLTPSLSDPPLHPRLSCRSLSPPSWALTAAVSRTSSTPCSSCSASAPSSSA